VLAERRGQAVRILEFDELDPKAFIVMSNHPATVPGQNYQGVDIGPKPRRDGGATQGDIDDTARMHLTRRQKRLKKSMPAKRKRKELSALHSAMNVSRSRPEI
jgi:hypothetical protein